MEWKSIKVMVKLSVINRVVRIQFVFKIDDWSKQLDELLFIFCVRYQQATPTVVPTASAMLLKELKEPPRDRKKVKNVVHSGNITLDAVIDIARVLRSKSMARKLEGTVLEVLGTANSLGCKVNGQVPKDLQAEIKAGNVTIPEE